MYIGTPSEMTLPATDRRSKGQQPLEPREVLEYMGRIFEIVTREFERLEEDLDSDDSQDAMKRPKATCKPSFRTPS